MKIASIESVQHTIYTFGDSTWSVHYSSGKWRTYTKYEDLPKTVKAFINAHYSILVTRKPFETHFYYAFQIKE